MNGIFRVNSLWYVIILSTLLLVSSSYASEKSDNVDRASVPDLFSPSGWEGDLQSVKIEYECPLKPHSGQYCQKWTYSGELSDGAGWAGVCWQYPANSWTREKGRDMSAFTILSFWARGEKGGEVISFRTGGGADEFSKIQGPIKLNTDWQKFSFDLAKDNLSNVQNGFCWSVQRMDNPDGCVFYIDDMKFE
ncbi:hypothetical protein ACFL0T_04350 [Candidatus Omnitrophota bacterium]